MENNSIINLELMRYSNKKYKDIWDAIRDSSSVLIKNNYITNKWLEKLKSLTDNYGYYFILTDDMVFPHISPGSETIKDCVAFSILKYPVNIDHKNHKTRKIKFILTLVSITGDGHMDILQKIIQLWNDHLWLNLIGNINSQKEMIKIERYLNKLKGIGE
ncbi:PTS sugar transporter subunit IIA [Spiroplasma endosymbiont of Aspidapion aeneum]|uniref:PTS sugar transporter subunit IIA n=1 Tax=Spiroplasma endosymbiont of Aspidapion aeneum TaxID=3066276 RepID=UPI00313CD4ED